MCGVFRRSLELIGSHPSAPRHDLPGTGWTVHEEVRIGGRNASGPARLEGRGPVAVDGGGCIYVAVPLAGEVRVFDPHGRWLETLTVPTERPGPGTVGGLVFDPGGNLWVVDQRENRFVVFDLRERMVDVLPRPAGGGLWIPWPGGMDREGRLHDMVRLHRGDEEIEVLARLGPGLVPEALLRAPTEPPEGSEERAWASFAPHVSRVLDPSGLQWEGHSARYRLVLAAPDGTAVRVVEREHDPVPVTDEDRAVLAGKLALIGEGMPPDAVPLPATKPVFRDLVTDAEGHLWVGLHARAGAAVWPWDVFDPEGRYLARVMLPAGALVQVIRDDHVYTVEPDGDRGASVVRYRIRRGAPPV